MPITVERQGPASIVLMNNPPFNLMTIDVMKELVAAHQEADQDPNSRVIVTRSALPNMFSNGLDPRHVLSRQGADRVEIFDWVARMLHGLFALNKPHIAVINGPAMAGGAILAITADFRLFDAEAGRISFSETKVGLPVPEAVAAVVAHFCARPRLREIVMLAKNMDAKDAHEAGLADALASGKALDETAAKLVERLSRLSPAVLQATKKGLRRSTLELTEAMQRGRDDTFMRFAGDEFLGEGLKALVEQRFPNFAK